MTLRMILDQIEALPVRLCIALLRRLGPVRASNLGGAIARAIGPRLPVTRVGDANLRLAFPDMDAATRKATLRAVWDNLGRVAGELPHIADLSATKSGPGWEVVGGEHLLALAGKGAVICVSGHIGNWEMLPAMSASYGLPLSNFYRAAANPVVDRLISRLRSRAVDSGVPNFAKGAQGARAALLHLGRGGCLGMLVDQKMNDGIPAPFFGRLAMTAPAAAAYALRFRCPVIVARTQRLGPARARLIVDPPLVLPDSGDRKADIASVTATINARLEDFIRDRPGEWLWLHRRWPKNDSERQRTLAG